MQGHLLDVLLVDLCITPVETQENKAFCRSPDPLHNSYVSDWYVIRPENPYTLRGEVPQSEMEGLKTH